MSMRIVAFAGSLRSASWASRPPSNPFRGKAASKADQAFDEAGLLKDGALKSQVERACAELLRVTAALKHA